MGKYTALKKTLPALPPEIKFEDGAAYQEKVDRLKAELLSKTREELAEAYKACCVVEEEIKKDTSELNVQFEALNQLLVEQMNASGLTSFKLASGGSFSLRDKPRTTVEDKQACREWFEQRGLKEMLNVHPSSLSAMVNGILENPLEPNPDNPDEMRPKALPAGIKIYMDTSVEMRKK